MREKECVFCFEGINNRVWEIPKLFTGEMLEEMKKTSTMAKDYLGIDVWERIQEGKTTDDFENSYIELVGTFLSDCVIYRQYIKSNIKPECFVGFSLGLNTALVCSGAITFEQGLELLVINKKCMEYYKEAGNFGMAFIVGLSKEVIEGIVEKKKYTSHIKIAGEASDYSVLITGDLEKIQSLEPELLEEGAMRFNRIQSFTPFHFGMHLPLADEQINRVRSFTTKQQQCLVYSAYTLKSIRTKEEVVEELTKNFTTPMRWKELILMLEGKGFREFWDISITGSNKKISVLEERDSIFYTLKDYKKTLHKAIE